MIRLIDILLEGKQVGSLYHFTPLSNLISILINAKKYGLKAVYHSGPFLLLTVGG
jgi:hypothetical protein